MPSPFPGMNPFLEQDEAWTDFHQSFIIALRDALSPQVSPEYVVKVEARIYVHEVPTEERTFLGRGDVGISANDPAPASDAATALLDAPVQIELPAVDFERSAF